MIAARARTARSRVLRRLGADDRTLLVGTLGTGVLNVATTGLNFLLTFTLARILGADGFGAYAYGFAWASMLAVPSVLGLTPLVIRNVAAYRERREWGLLRGVVTRTNQAVLTSSALLVTAGFLAGLLVNGGNEELLNPLLVGLALVPLIALTSIRQAAMQGLNHVLLGRVPETLLAPSLFLGLVGVAYAIGGDSLSAAWTIGFQATAFLASFALGAYLLRRVMPAQARTEPSQYEMRAWLRSALPLLIFSAVQALNAQIEVILLSVLKGPTEAGIYSIAVRVTGLIAFVIAAAGYPLSPLIARQFAAGDADALRRTVRRAATVIFVASLPVAVGILVFSEQLLGLFGGDFEGNSATIGILALSQIVFAATGLAGTVLVMTHHESLLLRSALVSAVANVLLNALLIPPFGIEGAAAAGTISLVLMSGVASYYARRRAGIPSTAFGI